MHTPRRYGSRDLVLQNGTEIRDDHAQRLLPRRHKVRPLFTRFSVLLGFLLPLLYAREFRPPNIYLLVALDGCMFDIS